MIRSQKYEQIVLCLKYTLTQTISLQFQNTIKLITISKYYYKIKKWFNNQSMFCKISETKCVPGSTNSSRFVSRELNASMMRSRCRHFYISATTTSCGVNPISSNSRTSEIVQITHRTKKFISKQSAICSKQFTATSKVSKIEAGLYNH